MMTPTEKEAVVTTLIATLVQVAVVWVGFYLLIATPIWTWWWFPTFLSGWYLLILCHSAKRSARKDMGRLLRRAGERVQP